MCVNRERLASKGFRACATQLVFIVTTGHWVITSSVAPAETHRPRERAAGALPRAVGHPTQPNAMIALQRLSQSPPRACLTDGVSALRGGGVSATRWANDKNTGGQGVPTLDWIGKQAVVNHHREVPYRLVHCDGELSAGDPEAGNLLVQGDNLEALRG